MIFHEIISEKAYEDEFNARTSHKCLGVPYCSIQTQFFSHCLVYCPLATEAMFCPINDEQEVKEKLQTNQH